MEKNLNIKAVLFDIDNTLILFDERKFFETYSKKLYLAFQDLMTPEDFIQKLIRSTQVMTNNDGKKSNAQFFFDDFTNGLVVDKIELWQRFENFYATEFDQFKKLATPLDEVVEVISEIKNRGLKIVIASNPMFPENVQSMRLNWAGLKNFSFDLITSAENSTYCKPHLNYYLEICSKIKLKPENCLMVGNDPFNDMIASKIGMKTFLTTDSEKYTMEFSRELAKNNKLEMPEPDFKGPLKNLPQIF
jgi:HAD superfamily hydrolase (TIGR01549 family)